MANKKFTKRALFGSVIALILCCAMLVGTTFAWFTDSASSAINTIESGNLDISLWHTTYWESVANNEWSLGIGFYGEGNEVKEDTALFLNKDGKAIKWEPGAEAYENFRIKNDGDLALKYQFQLNIANATATPAGKTLADVISIYIDEIAYEDNGVATGTTVVAGELFGEDNAYIVEGELLPGESDDLAVNLCWVPTANDNDYNVDGGLKVDLSISLVATQFTYEKDFEDDQYDKDAEYPAAEAGMKVITPADVEGEDSYVVEAGQSAKFDPETTKFDMNYIEVAGNATFGAGAYDLGTAADYATIIYGSGVYNDAEITSGGGGVAAANGGNVVFNSGSVYVDTASTSGRYIFYTEGEGSEITINDGTFSWDPADNQKRAYIYAGAGTTVYVNGGTFGKASTRSGYTAGILGEGTIVIKGGTFGFDPSAWVAEGYEAVKSGTTWTVSAK